MSSQANNDGTGSSIETDKLEESIAADIVESILLVSFFLLLIRLLIQISRMLMKT